MKIFSLILSVVVLFIASYFFAIKVGDIHSLNDIIYISLLGILMAICVIGIVVNFDIIRRRRKSRVILFVSNNFSKKNK